MKSYGQFCPIAKAAELFPGNYFNFRSSELQFKCVCQNRWLCQTSTFHAVGTFESDTLKF